MEFQQPCPAQLIMSYIVKLNICTLCALVLGIFSFDISLQLPFSFSCISLFSSDVQTLDFPHTFILLCCVCILLYIHLFSFLACTLLVIECSIAIVQPYFLCFVFLMLLAQVDLIHSFILSLICIRFLMYCACLLCVSFCCPCVFCVIVPVLVYIFVHHFDTANTLSFSSVLHCTLFGLLYLYRRCVFPKFEFHSC